MIQFITHQPSLQQACKKFLTLLIHMATPTGAINILKFWLCFYTNPIKFRNNGLKITKLSGKTRGCRLMNNVKQQTPTMLTKGGIKQQII